LARGPLPVWRLTGAGPSDSQAPPTALAGSSLEWFAVLYRRCANTFGWSPAAVNEMEAWEIGAALGSATEETEAWLAMNRPADNPADVQSKSRDLVAERVLAHREGRPQPEASVMSTGQVGMLQERLRVS
jgi:hypothetical protein